MKATLQNQGFRDPDPAPADTASLPIRYAIKKEDFDRELAAKRDASIQHQREVEALAASLQNDPRSEKLRLEAQKASELLREARRPLDELMFDLRESTKRLAIIESERAPLLNSPDASPLARKRAEAEVAAARAEQNKCAAALSEARARADDAAKRHTAALAAMQRHSDEHRRRIAKRDPYVKR